MTGHTHDRVAQSKALKLTLGVNAAYLVVEVIGGVVFGSLALLADAAHMLSDVAGLTIALIAHRLIEKPSTSRNTYGLQRAEVMGAQLNGLIMVAAAIWVFVEAARRAGDSFVVEGGGLAAVAAIGLLINIGSALILARSRGRSLNMRGAFLHMVMDALGSAGALLAGLVILLSGAEWIDTAVSVAIGLLVLWSGWHLVRETGRVLMEFAPSDIDPEEVETAIGEDPDVEGVHHLHLWSLASDAPALSAHVIVEGERTLHDAQIVGDRVEGMLGERFGIGHVTLQLECHPCEPGAEEASDAEGRR